MPSFANSFDRCYWQTKLLAKLSFPLPTAAASLLAKVMASELTAFPLRQRHTWLLAKLSNRARVPVGEELFPIT
jgi:hypothetical protein